MNHFIQNKITCILALVTTLAAIAPAQRCKSDSIVPMSYAMPNGSGVSHGGQFNYWDLFYDGVGNTTTDRAPLSDGLGDLTDGVIAAGNWFNVENVQGTGPYVGWDIDPVITFEFETSVAFDTIRIHFDDANGAGLVSPPTSVTVQAGAFEETYFVTDDPDPSPFWFEIDLTGDDIVESTITLAFDRQTLWVMASEIEFVGTPLHIIAPDEVNVVLGNNILGTLNDVARSDDEYFCFLNDAPFSVGGPSVWLDFEGTSPTQTPNSLGITVEAQSSSNDIDQKIFAFNYDSSTWELVDTSETGFNVDTVANVELTGDLARFVDDATGEIKMRVTYTQGPAAIFLVWAACIDQLVWAVSE